METNVLKEFYFQDVNSYNNQTLQVPEGYEFMQFLSVDGGPNNSYGRIIAVYKKDIPFKEAIEAINKRSNESLETQKKYLEEQFAKRVKNMQIEQAFSEIITKFKLGDSVYYYDEYVSSYGKSEICADHIKSFSLDAVVFEKEVVSINGHNDIDGNQQSAWLVLKNWDKKVHPNKAYKTKEEAIIGSQEYHDAKLKQIEEDKKKAEALAVENKKKRDAEILAEAEKIKNEQQ